MTEVRTLYIVGKHVIGLWFLEFSVSSDFGIRKVTPSVSHSKDCSGFLRILL